MKYLSIDINILTQSDTWLAAHKNPWIALASMNLWMTAALRDAEGIPNDDFALAKYAGVSDEVWGQIKGVVLRSWRSDKNRVFHPIVSAEVKRFKKASASGKAGAKKRWENNNVDGNPIRVDGEDPNATPLGSPPGDPISSSLVRVKVTPPTPSENQPASPPPAAAAIFDRVIRLLKIDPGKFRRNAGWVNFPATIAAWIDAGCDPELDIWPTIERIGLAKVAAGEIPKTPGYFNAAILEARNLRRVANPAGSGMVTTETCTDPFEWSDRLAVWRRSKKWSAKWGPKPDHADTLVPRFILDHPEGHVHPEFRTPPEPKWEWLPDGGHNWPKINGL